MSHPASPQNLAQLNGFKFEKLINEDPATHSLTLLGSFPDLQGQDQVTAIVRIEKTTLNASDAHRFFGENGLIKKAVLEESTDIYTWLFAWLGEDRERDIKINVVCPATEVHIRKYTRQELIMVSETPELYKKVVKPYIEAFPPSRTKWVENILTGVSEQNKILYSSGLFVILPDMKWDLQTVSSLYLTAIVRDKSIRSLRDLRRRHVGLLQNIRKEAYSIVESKWNLGHGSLRMLIHYQPSYYHFHVHIVNANYQAGSVGMMVGQAHLLEDIISLLELDSIDGPGVFERMTLTYALGDQHGLYQGLKDVGA
ncbi:scavenger mRNA decapping enzyme [Panaeolus papilionaceus]|nr:scavenger mRNA decapping enzyme [Panaeolus papilionaceus]